MSICSPQCLSSSAHCRELDCKPSAWFQRKRGIQPYGDYDSVARAPYIGATFPGHVYQYPPHHASIMIIKSFCCRYLWMPRDASSEPDSVRSPLSLRGSWGLVAAGLLSVVSGAALGLGDASATGQWRKRHLLQAPGCQ